MRNLRFTIYDLRELGSRVFLLLLVALAVLLPSRPACAADLITFHLAVTNTPADGDTITINGTTRTWKTTVANAATQIQTTNVLGQAATNLFQQLGTYPITGVITLTVTNTNVTVLGLSLSASVTSGWSINFFTTNTVGTSRIVNTPFTVYTAAIATNVASDLVTALDQYNTNNFTATNVALSNYVNRSTTQTVGGIKTFTNLNGTVGSFTNGGFLNPTFTNAVNNGNAFSSPGSASFSEQFGASATATALAATALGNGAVASGLASAVFGEGSTASGSGAVVIGGSSSAIADGAIAIGNGTVSSNLNSIVIGAAAVSTVDNQIVLGTVGYSTLVPGDISMIGHVKTNLTVDANFTANGSNRVNSSWAWTRHNNTSLATGANAAVDVGTNFYVKVSGPGAAFSIAGIAGGWDGREVLIQNSTGFTMTIANESGGDPTAANRIQTGMGADVAITNNPGNVRFVYDSALSRWVVVGWNKL